MKNLKSERKTNCPQCKVLFQSAKGLSNHLRYGCTNLNKERKWSLKYKSCINCKSTKYKYEGKGLCEDCYDAMYYVKNRTRLIKYGKEYNKINYPKFRKRHLDYSKKYNQLPRVKLINVVKSRKMYKKYPEKHRARALFHYYLRIGKLEKLPCQICGTIESEAHHPNYTKPLEVKWLCLEHHRIEEGRWHEY